MDDVSAFEGRGVPEYEDLTPEDRECFTELVAKGPDGIFAHVEDCKRAVLAAGLGSMVKDEWLGFLSAAQFDPVVGLPGRVRDRLGRMLDDIYPLVVRLDPDAAGAESAKARRGQWPEKRTNQEVASFLSERAVKYRPLGQDSLKGKPGSLKAFTDVFGPTAIAHVINQKLEVTAKAKMCKKQDVSATKTYITLIKPLMRKHAIPPEGWPTDDDGTDTADDILDDLL